jgi:hypothetical protein
MPLSSVGVEGAESGGKRMPDSAPISPRCTGSPQILLTLQDAL